MKKTCGYCDTDLLSRFTDNELDPDEHARIQKHLMDCTSCQKELRDNQSISALIQTHLKKEISQANLDDLEEKVLSLINKKRTSWSMKLKDLFLSWKLLIPATVMAAMFVLFLFPARHFSPALGPSAIVNTIEGNVSSVILLETPESRRTIIWFNETS